MVPVILQLLSAALVQSAPPQPSQDIKVDIDWKTYLGRADPVWQWDSTDRNTPKKWDQSSFMGNGRTGAMIWINTTSEATRSLHLELGRTDVYDDRAPGAPYSVGNFAVDRPRLPLGNLHVYSPQYSINGGSMRLDLWKAKTQGTLQTTAAGGGAIVFNCTVFARPDLADVILLEVDASAHPVDPVIKFFPEEARSTWADSSYVPNPDPVTISYNSTNITTQGHLSGKAHAIGVLVYQRGNRRYAIFLAVSPVLDSPAIAQKWADDQLQAGFRLWNEGRYISEHEGWWASYYPKSVVALSVTWLESFYWLQMYKLASATRADGTIHDLVGPWYVNWTPWPDLHWDLNVQFTYLPLYTANRIDIASSLSQFIVNSADAFVLNVPEAWRRDSSAAPTAASALDALMSCYWDYGKDPSTGDCVSNSPSITGNLMWVMHLLFNQFLFTQNDTFIRSDVYPILRRAVNFYMHLSYTGNDGKLHLVKTFSPEYPGPRSNDTNYDLSLFRWGLQTALWCIDQLGIHDVAEPRWRSALSSLTDYPRDDKHGYYISRGIPLSTSHRHFSHLFMVWPLKLLNLSDAAQTRLAKISVDYWINFEGALTGFAYPAASSMNSYFASHAFGNDGSAAEKQEVSTRSWYAFTNVTRVVDTKVLPSTFYKEGENAPCGETPPAISSAMQDWFLLSEAEYIHVFPAVDPTLGDVSFHSLRAAGAFLVSARKVKQNTTFIRIYSEAGKPLVLKSDLAWPWRVDPPSVKVERLNPAGLYAITLDQQQAVVLTSAQQSAVDLRVVSTTGCVADYNFWGLPRGKAKASVYASLQVCDGQASQQWLLQQQQTAFALHPKLDSSLCLVSNECEGRVENGEEEAKAVKMRVLPCELLDHPFASTSTSTSTATAPDPQCYSPTMNPRCSDGHWHFLDQTRLTSIIQPGAQLVYENGEIRMDGECLTLTK